MVNVDPFIWPYIHGSIMGRATPSHQKSWDFSTIPSSCCGVPRVPPMTWAGNQQLNDWFFERHGSILFQDIPQKTWKNTKGVAIWKPAGSTPWGEEHHDGSVEVSRSDFFQGWNEGDLGKTNWLILLVDLSIILIYIYICLKSRFISNQLHVLYQIWTYDSCSSRPSRKTAFKRFPAAGLGWRFWHGCGWRRLGQLPWRKWWLMTRSHSWQSH